MKGEKREKERGKGKGKEREREEGGEPKIIVNMVIQGGLGVRYLNCGELDTDPSSHCLLDVDLSYLVQYLQGCMKSVSLYGDCRVYLTPSPVQCC